MLRLNNCFLASILGALAINSACLAEDFAPAVDQVKGLFPDWTVRYRSTELEYRSGIFTHSWRIILQNNEPVWFGGLQQQAEVEQPSRASMTVHNHLEIVLVPPSQDHPPNLPNLPGGNPWEQMDWQHLEQQSLPVSTDLGTNEMGHWYASGPLSELQKLPSSLHTTGGEDRADLAIRAFNAACEKMDTWDSRYYSPTYSAAAEMLQSIGPAALDMIKDQLRQTRYTTDYMNIVRQIPGDKSTAMLISLRHDDDPEMARAAMSAILDSAPPRVSAKAEILDALANDPYFTADAAKVAADQQWTEALPALGKHRQTTKTLDVYEAVYRAQRQLNGNPFPPEIDKAEQTLRFTGKAEPTGVAEAKEVLQKHPDKQAVAIIAARLIQARTKGDMSSMNEIGKEIFKSLPPAATAEVSKFVDVDKPSGHQH